MIAVKPRWRRSRLFTRGDAETGQTLSNYMNVVVTNEPFDLSHAALIAEAVLFRTRRRQRVQGNRYPRQLRRLLLFGSGYTGPGQPFGHV